jgi:pyruvate/2-oxoglutarate dehydrogenase complex dihydrolipoamide dehydrogenase (E3) component
MNSSERETFDAIVIGAGQAGGPLAGALGKAGWKVALIEKEHVGGTCVNEGCTPTKTMVASARVAYLARRAADYGVQTGAVQVDLSRVRERTQALVESFRSGSRKSLEKVDNVTLIMGEAHFVSPHEVEVTSAEDGGKRTLAAEKIFINAGARPVLPPIEGLDAVPALTSKTILELESVPEHLLVMGGGYIGLEFAQMFRRFGSDVTLIQRGPQLLAREDEDVADEIAEILREDGVTVHLETEVTAAAQDDRGRLSLTLKGKEGERRLGGSHLLVATGRKPNSDLLNLEAAGLETDEQGSIRVNGKLETSVPGIYALGDIKGGPAFTHISYDDYRIVRDNLLKGADKTTEGRPVPYTVFTDPQLGRVGLSEAQAREQGFDIKVAKLPMSSAARALELDETRGFMKAVVDAQNGRILGAAILGVEGGEVMSTLQVAMMGGLTYEALRDSPFAHPLLSESLNNLFTTLS